MFSTSGAAIWAPMTLAELAARSELIVVGGLTAIENQSADSRDVGKITIEQVLKAPASQRQVASVRLLLPSATRPISSDVVTYKQGQRGIWFLRRDPASPESPRYLADHPDRLKPVSELSQVRAFLQSAPSR